MRKLMLCGAVGALVFCSLTPALASAAKPPAKSPEERFSKIDANGDKKLSLEEFVGKRTGQQQERATRRFGKLDKDSDKFLSLDEFKTGQKKKA